MTLCAANSLDDTAKCALTTSVDQVPGTSYSAQWNYDKE